MALKSMTGYGKGLYEKDGVKLTVEMKTVNHRFLDLTIKMPKSFNFCEDQIRKSIKDNFARGHFDIFLTVEDTREDQTTVSVDYSLANAYLEAARKISKDLLVKDNLNAYELLQMPGVVSTTLNDENDELLLEIVNYALSIAMKNLDTMRTNEGKLMYQDFKNKMEYISEIVSKIEANSKNVVEEHFAKVRARIQEMLQDVAVDEARMLNEVAFYTDKVCIDEEIQRLKTHIVHFNEIIDKGGLVGKQLDFIVQEMNREANTCGSKCNNIEISSLVVALKNEIEKVREQIQNIE